MKRQKKPLLFTMGHSTLSIDQFTGRLRNFGITSVIDIRTIPKSRHNPQFCKELFASKLKRYGISYFHLKDLGGLRKPAKDSINLGWTNASFRGYADYMQTTQFEEALAKLVSLAKLGPSVIICAEAVPWKCHRSLVADALVALEYRIEHILSDTVVKPHILNPMAVVSHSHVSYPRPVGTTSSTA